MSNALGAHAIVFLLAAILIELLSLLVTYYITLSSQILKMI